MQQGESDSLGLGGGGNDFCQFALPLPFGIAFRIDFWTARTSKMVLPLQWEHDFGKVSVVAQTLQKGAPGIHVEGPKSNKERQNRADSVPPCQKMGPLFDRKAASPPQFLRGWRRVLAILPFFV